MRDGDVREMKTLDAKTKDNLAQSVTDVVLTFNVKVVRARAKKKIVNEETKNAELVTTVA